MSKACTYMVALAAIVTKCGVSLRLAIVVHNVDNYVSMLEENQLNTLFGFR